MTDMTSPYVTAAGYTGGTGFTGATGFTGTTGYTGTTGSTGFTGSTGDLSKVHPLPDFAFQQLRMRSVSEMCTLHLK